MGEESLLDDMRAAVRGDFERARERREGGADVDPSPVVSEVRGQAPPAELDTPPDAVNIEAVEPARRGFLAKLFR